MTDFRWIRDKTPKVLLKYIVSHSYFVAEIFIIVNSSFWSNEKKNSTGILSVYQVSSQHCEVMIW